MKVLQNITTKYLSTSYSMANMSPFLSQFSKTTACASINTIVNIIVIVKRNINAMKGKKVHERSGTITICRHVLF